MVCYGIFWSRQLLSLLDANLHWTNYSCGGRGFVVWRPDGANSTMVEAGVDLLEQAWHFKMLLNALRKFSNFQA